MTIGTDSGYTRSVLAPLSARRVRDALWLGIALLSGCIVYLSYLAVHTYPAYAGGLYLAMAEQIISNGYFLPVDIPLYTETGVPFAYPPLGFYATAIAHDVTGIPLLWFTRFIPGLFVLAYLIPFYAVARELLDSPQQAGLATILFAMTPTVLRWHLSAGGLVRAPAMFLAVSGVYVGIRLFSSGNRQWVLPGTALFTLTILTHPTYTVFFGLSYLLLFAFYDRSRAGFVHGAIVAVGGIVLTSPWWLVVMSRHGPDIFFTASGTHSGLGGGLRRLAIKLTYALNDMDLESLFYYTAYAGGLYSLIRRRYFLPTWVVASSYFIGKNRFLFVAGSMLTSWFVFEAIIPRLRRLSLSRHRERLVAAGTVLLVVVSAVTIGTLYSASALPLAHQHSPSQPSYMDDADQRAMHWVRSHAAPTDEFVVLGDAAEWFPLLTDRAILLGPWGWEWKQSAGYYREIERYDSISTCQTAWCLTKSLERADRVPTYVYVFKGGYTVRGKQHQQSPILLRSLRRSGQYRQAYENDGVVIFAITDWGTPV